MNRKTKEQWLALFKAHEQSGLSATAFCKEHAINAKYFSQRRKQLQSAGSLHDNNAFVRVQPLEHQVDNQQIKLRGNYGELFLPGSVSPEWLAMLLKQLT